MDSFESWFQYRVKIQKKVFHDTYNNQYYNCVTGRMIMEMSEKIIVIDDNPEIREVVKVLLSSEGYTILEAKNAE